MNHLPAIDALTVDDLTRLVGNRVSEGRDLEYKQQLPGPTDDSKREFLADLSSLANTAGGYLLFGVEEERDPAGKPTGVAGRLRGLGAGINSGAEIARLENLARDGLEPRIPGMRWREVLGAEDGSVLACWVPRSWQAPHMVAFQRWSRFFARNSSGKYPLNVGEIRSAILAGEELNARVRRYRAERLAHIGANDGPVVVRPGAHHVLQVVSAVSLLSPRGVTIPLASAKLLPLGGGCSHRFNADGLLGVDFDRNGEAWRYIQVFRDGAIETVEYEDPEKLASTHVETTVAQAAQAYLQALAEWEIPPPWFVMISFLGVKGARFYTRTNVEYYEQGWIDRDVLLLPEIVVDSDPPATIDEALTLLRPAYDVLWQAAGYERSLNFNEGGAWIRG